MIANIFFCYFFFNNFLIIGAQIWHVNIFEFIKNKIFE